ncbi:MAG: transglutaminase family protein, partial [Planctomycetota bacterium]
KRFGNDTFVHYGQGKWYPGEPLPRWSKTCYARKDGKPIWKNQEFLAAEGEDHQHNDADARKLVEGIAERLNVDDQNVAAVYEDALYHIWQEQRLPQNVDLNDLESVQNDIDRNRLAQVLQKGLSNPSGYILPLMFDRNLSRPRWRSGHWKTKADRIFLVPGDSPIGYRLPLKSLQSISEQQQKFYQPLSPVVHRDPLPDPETFRLLHQSNLDMTDRRIEAELLANAPLDPSSRSKLHRNRTGQTALLDPLFDIVKDADSHNADLASEPEDDVCPTIDFDQQALPFALCAEVRNGTVHVFLPPTDQLEQYLEILSAIEESATQFELPVIIEGYQPPRDHRLKSFSITPDPGVIEVNVAPSATWKELKETTAGLYEDAYHSRLGTEKFDVDGAHTGTGGGNHVVLGGPSPLESPLLRRPDLLKSLLGFWQNHPSLSYLFSSRFVGSTSQAPRVDEGRVDALYELQIAFDELDRQIQRDEGCPPWMADRIFRNLLIDVTGNTHRAEFCIDKLYSPDSATGKLGLLEFRGFEMPPHHQMSLTQQLLIRTLVAKFWNEPYRQPLVDWGTRLHDQFMLPTFVWRDFCDVAEICQQSGYEVEADWFQSHFEFRFPFIGGFTHNSVDVEIRQAIEPWNVLGEESTASGTSRYVDSSIERMELKVSGFVDERYLIVCNGIEVPLHPTEQAGQYVAGVRFRAWQPPSCLHPTIPVDGPLVFDLYDRWLGRSVDGCQYFVGHPGGLNPTIRPVNSLEAESRRAARFSKIGHSGTKGNPRKARPNNDFPMTLDLRREKN